MPAESFERHVCLYSVIVAAKIRGRTRKFAKFSTVKTGWEMDGKKKMKECERDGNGPAGKSNSTPVHIFDCISALLLRYQQREHCSQLHSAQKMPFWRVLSPHTIYDMRIGGIEELAAAPWTYNCCYLDAAALSHQDRLNYAEIIRIIPIVARSWYRGSERGFPRHNGP